MCGSKKSIALFIVVAFVLSTFGSILATSSAPGVSASSMEITLTTPDGGEIYEAGSVQTIEWTTNLTGSAAIDPVGHWKLDEQSGTIAYDSIGTNDGTLNNLGESQWTPARIDGGLYYPNIVAHIEILDDDALDFGLNEDFSIYCWLKTTKRGGYIIDKRASEHLGYTFFVTGADQGYLAAKLGDGSSIVVASTEFIADGVWHHLGMVKEGNVLQLFVDGTMVKSTLGANKNYSNTAPLRFGKTFTGTYPFEGTLDDVKIYDRAVYPDEVYSTPALVDICYSIDNGATWTLEATGEANDGSYEWTTPMVDSDHCLVKIIATDDSQTYEDISDGIFTIYLPGEVDLSISDNDISFSDNVPVAGTPVTIEATVHGDRSIASSLDHYGKVVPIGGFEEDLYVHKPSVIKEDDGSYVMWYTGKGDDGLKYRERIFRAISPDGISWTKTGMAMDYGGAYMEYGVSHPFVMKDDAGLYHMWHTGIGYSGGYRYNIHYATSIDGITWQKMGLEFTYGASFQPDGVFSPYVHFDGTEWHMWYNGVSWGPDITRTNYAHKTDMTDPWIFEGTVLDIIGPYDNAGAYYPQVLPTDSGYEMYYTGRDTNNNYRVLHATSSDGMAWTRNGIFLDADPVVGTSLVSSAYVIYESGVQKIWYSGYDNSNTEVYYAEKTPATPGQDATCTVSFYLDSIAPENLIYREYGVFVPGDGATTVSSTWIADIAGMHDIIVDVTDVDPADIDLSNNKASSSIYIQNTATATANGPQGANHDPFITLTYTWTDSPILVDLFYSNDNGDSWNYIGTDNTIDGTFDWIPGENSGPKPSKYYWIANAQGGQDDVGTPVNGTDPEAGPFNWKTIDLDMNTENLNVKKDDGFWYFVSTSLAVSGDAVTIFNDETWGDGGSEWDIIWWYDPTDVADHWKSYNKLQFAAGITQDIPNVDNTMGLWIHITRNNGDGSLTIGEGIQPVSTSISLYAGWNMVGYPSQRTDLTVSEAFWGTGTDKVEVFDPAHPYMIKMVGPEYVMQPGEAYWVHVPVDTVWTVNW